MIIPVHRVTTFQIPIEATTTMEAGQVVAIDANGYASECGDAGTPIGVAADRNRAVEAYEWTNRASDYGNETRASGQMSIYSHGIFWFDVDDSAITTPAGTSIEGVVVNGAATINDTAYCAASGQINDSGTITIGTFMTGEVDLDSGIPGEYEPGSSVAYKDDSTPRKWAKIKLSI